VKRSDYDATKEEHLFDLALELSITWVNHILFLKLLEGQLVKYHRGDKAYKFLNRERILDYDTLNKLFAGHARKRTQRAGEKKGLETSRT
jgi:adenine-specific DNA-methyltransferase